VAASGIFLARSFYLSRAGSLRRRKLVSRAPRLVAAARDKFYVDEIYGRALVLPAKRFAVYLADVFDRRVIDGIVNGTARLIGRSSEGLRGLQTGYVRNYAVIFLFGVVVVFSVLLARVSV
jgi:NADH-quinone oxidoreductase subunit L